MIPVLNEEKTIQRTIKMLEELEGDREVVFVDGGSTDGTTRLIPAHYKQVKSPKGRALQMNAGAKYATGEILLFLHSDSLLGADSLHRIAECIKAGYDGGCFAMMFSTRGFMLNTISFLSNLRVRLLRVMFGDQCIFVKKDVFESLGGFPEIQLMEDLEFSLKLRRHGKIKQLRAKVITSARRFEKNGILRTMLLMHKLKILYFMGVSPEKLNRMYRNVR